MLSCSSVLLSLSLSLSLFSSWSYPRRVIGYRFGEGRTLNLAALDVVRDVLRTSAIYLAANTESRTQNLLHRSLQLLGERLEPHRPGNLDDVVERHALVVLDVLLLFPVAGGLLQGLDDKGRGGGDDRDGGLTVLDGKLDGDTETFLSTGSHISGRFPLPASISYFVNFGRCLPSHQWPWRYLLRPSWGKDPEDRSWERGRKRHRPHHQWQGGG